MSKRGKFMGMEVIDLDKGETVKGSLQDKIEETKAEKSLEEKSEKRVLKGKVFNCDNLNLREADNQVSKIIKILPKGTELEICEEFGKWYRVKVNGYDGYVMAQYVEVM